MSDELVTIATFWNTVEANLARNRLEDGGLHAFLADEEATSMTWALTNALGGIKLQVYARESEDARAILEERGAADLGAPGPAEDTSSWRNEAERPLEQGGADADVDEAEPETTTRERDAERALRGAIFGLLFLPLQLYVFWLLLKVFVSDEPLRAAKRRRALIAALINLPIVVVFCLVLWAMF